MSIRFPLGVRRWLAVACVICSAAVHAADPEPLAQLVTEALASNPGLAAIEARALALAEIPEQQEALPDPRLSLNVVNIPLDSFSFSQEPMSQFQVGVTQALPYPGKLAISAAIARHDVTVAEADVAERRLQLARDVKTLWWNLVYLEKALAIIERNQALLGQIINVAETRYQVGQGHQQDILLAQLELSKLRDGAIRLQNLKQNETARLNVLLGRAAGNAIQIPSSVSEDLLILADLESLQKRAEMTHPRLQAQQGRMNAARSRVELAKKDYSPDFTLGAVYGLRSGSNADGSNRADFASVMFSMNLPIYSGRKQAPAVDQFNAQWMRQKYELHDQHNRVAANVAQARNDYQFAVEQNQLFKQEIIPQARQTVEATLAGYQVGHVDFLSLIRSQTTLYDCETQYWKSLSSANQALARLIVAVGEENIYE